MFGSVGFGELLLIAVVILIIFGPHRLPEISRRIGDLLAMARRATREFTDALDAEFEDSTAPLRDLRTEYESTKQELTDAAGKISGTMLPADQVLGRDGLDDRPDAGGSVETPIPRIPEPDDDQRTGEDDTGTPTISETA
jgi:sec-independent protein translocase protein TatA